MRALGSTVRAINIMEDERSNVISSTRRRFFREIVSIHSNYILSLRAVYNGHDSTRTAMTVLVREKCVNLAAA